MSENKNLASVTIAQYKKKKSLGASVDQQPDCPWIVTVTEAGGFMDGSSENRIWAGWLMFIVMF